MSVIKSADYDGCCLKLRDFEHIHSAKPRACVSMLSSRGVWGHAPTGNFLRIHPSKVKSGVHLEQKVLD